METRSAEKRKKLQQLALSNDETLNNTDHEDRITNLPDDILHRILVFVPIKSVAQTSVLSKRWKTLWHSYPDLDFTSIDILASTNSTVTRSNGRKRKSSYVVKGAKCVDQIIELLARRSDIRVLRFRAFLNFSRLNGLIRQAVRRNVQELDVQVCTCDYFNFPRSLTTSRSLRILRVKSWHPGFRLPPLEVIKEGFRCLTSLSLARVILHDQPSLLTLFTDSSFPSLKKLHLEACYGLKYLRIECPVLEELSMENCYQLQNLEICVRELKKLRISGCFDAYSADTRVKINAPSLELFFWSYNAVTEEILLRNLTSLDEVIVAFYLLHEDLSVAKMSSVSNFLSGISNCRSLTLGSQCIETLSKDYRPAGVSLCLFNKLKILELNTGFHKHNNVGLASLFRSSPIIHTITIRILSDPNAERRQWNKDIWDLPNSGEERYWESQTQSLTSFLHHLKVVKIHGFTECANDVSLVKFFLKHGKVLEELFICTSLSRSKDSLLREKIKSQMMGFSRASSAANIVFQ